ncbi:hypothetical protein ABC304_17465 [Microbacterium sp. 1P10UB]|uniref:hypothetical protein n=1 Tax=unclassified Microbacterium TaxID=2609290 RepID=UPI0039A0A373
MRRTRTAHLCAALALTATAVFGMTACTASPTAAPAVSGSAGASAPASSGDDAGDGGQSTADACALVQQTISAATDDFQSASAEDPGAVADSMTAAAEQLSSISAQVTNDQVAAVVPELKDMFTQASGIMRSVADGDMSKVGDLTDLGTQFQETGQRFADICADNG